MKWDDDAKKRIDKAPFFIRFVAKARAEAAAKERGLDRVTSALLDELKSKEHKG